LRQEAFKDASGFVTKKADEAGKDLNSKTILLYTNKIGFALILQFSRQDLLRRLLIQSIQIQKGLGQFFSRLTHLNNGMGNAMNKVIAAFKGFV